MKNDPRIEKIIDQLEILEVLDEFHVDYTMHGKNIGVGYVGVRPCPFCGEANNHWAINIKQKFGTCFKCKEGMSTFRIISYYGRMNFDEVKEYLLDKYESDIDLVDQVTEIIRSKKEEPHYIPPKKDDLPDNKPITYNLIRQNPHYKSFFKKRKLYYWDIKKYDIRWSKDQVIFPIYFRNKIVSYQMRNIRHKWYSNGTNLGEYLCYEDHILEGKPLILVEGFLDYTRINSYVRIYHRNKISVTTGYVKMVSNKQIRRIISCKPSKVIVIFDYDSWFDYDIVKQKVPMDVDFIVLPKGKDPNDLTWSEIHSIFGEIYEP
jgi:hypothetical protein